MKRIATTCLLPMAGFLGGPSACLGDGGEARPRAVYRETFPDHRDASRYTRIAEASETWRVAEENGERFLRVTARPTRDHRRALVVWDLAPLQFDKLSVRVRAGTSGVRLSGAVVDRSGTSYLFESFGREGDGRKTVAHDGGWTTYTVRFPEDLRRIRRRGDEVSPFVHGPGEDVERWESIDFTNRGYKTIFFHLTFEGDSPAIGQEARLDLKDLELSVRQ